MFFQNEWQPEAVLDGIADFLQSHKVRLLEWRLPHPYCGLLWCLVSRVPQLSRLMLSSLAEYFFQRAGGVCRLWWHPVAWWGWGVLRPVLHRERLGGPTGAGSRALQHGRYTPPSGSPRSAWTSVLVPCMWVLVPSQWAPLHDGTTCRDAQGRGDAGGLWCM